MSVDPGDRVDGLRVEVDGPIATLVLDRPAKRNAVTYEMWLGIGAACDRLAGDPGVRLLVVRGEGEHFCAGADIGGLGAVPIEVYRAANAAADEALAAFPKPSVAVIRGSCVGGGVEVAAACDLRLAAEGSRFGITPARLGIVYPGEATRRVVDLVGPSAAKHLLFSAELINAERALRIGLIDELVSPDELEPRVTALSTLLTEERSLLTQMASKELIDGIAAHGTVDPEVEARWQAALADSADAIEGVVAFAERRTPRFTWMPAPDDGPDSHGRG